MCCRNLVRISVFCVVFACGATPVVAAEWKPHVVRQLNGAAPPIRIPAKLQIVTEQGDRVVAVPYLVYMPAKDRLLMLVGRDNPHMAMVMSSDNHGDTWSELRPVHCDAQGKPDVAMSTGLTYLGEGKVLLASVVQRWFSPNYGETWSNASAVGPTPSGKAWSVWDPLLVERDEATAVVTRLSETGYDVDLAAYQAATGAKYSQGHIRFSTDEGRTWSKGIVVPQWKGVNEVALLRAANGDWVGACRTDIPVKFKGQILDHYEGLGISISKDDGKTWSEVKQLYDWGRHHPSLLLMPNQNIVMTYVVRTGYVDDPRGFPQFGIEAVVSHDQGQTWDLDHRYLLHTWVGNRKGSNAWWASSQATSSVLLPDGAVLTAFGTGYRSQPGPNGIAPRDVGLVLWRLGDKPLNDARTIRDAPFDSDVRNLVDPAIGKPGSARGRQ